MNTCPNLDARALLTRIFLLSLASSLLYCCCRSLSPHNPILHRCKMASIGTLYTIPAQDLGKRVRCGITRLTFCEHLFSQIRAVAAFAGLSVDLPENYTHFETNKTPDFLAKFPHGKIPALETKDGFKLFESTAIARYSEHVFRLH